MYVVNTELSLWILKIPLFIKLNFIKSSFFLLNYSFLPFKSLHDPPFTIKMSCFLCKEAMFFLVTYDRIPRLLSYTQWSGSNSKWTQWDFLLSRHVQDFIICTFHLQASKQQCLTILPNLLYDLAQISWLFDSSSPENEEWLGFSMQRMSTPIEHLMSYIFVFAHPPEEWSGSWIKSVIVCHFKVARHFYYINVLNF